MKPLVYPLLCHKSLDGGGGSSSGDTTHGLLLYILTLRLLLKRICLYVVFFHIIISVPLLRTRNAQHARYLIGNIFLPLRNKPNHIGRRGVRPSADDLTFSTIAMAATTRFLHSLAQTGRHKHHRTHHHSTVYLIF